MGFGYLAFYQYLLLGLLLRYEVEREQDLQRLIQSSNSGLIPDLLERAGSLGVHSPNPSVRSPRLIGLPGVRGAGLSRDAA